MKKTILFLIFLIPLLNVGQQERVQISGYIQNELDEPIEGITIFNQDSYETTVTTSTGSYKIDVKVGDKIIFKSTLHEAVILTVTERTIEEKVIAMTIREGVNVLNEVVLEGDQYIYNIKKLERVDARTEKITGYNGKIIPAIDRAENTLSDKVRKSNEYSLRHEAQAQSQLRYNSFNLVGLLAAVVLNVALDALNINFGNAGTVRERFDVAVLENQFDANHLVEFLDIDKENLYDFIYFATDNGLTNEFVQSITEIELLQFLSDTATEYKKRK